jgi:PAS domain S-box-containing protein
MADCSAESGERNDTEPRRAAGLPSSHSDSIEQTPQDSTGQFSGDSVLNTLKLILAGAPLAEVLTIIARLVEAQSQGMLCSIFLLDNDGKHVRCASAPSLPGFISHIGGIPVGPGHAPCGSAAYRRQPVHVADILTDPLWQEYRHLLEPYGLRAVWARPLLSNEEQLLGTFASYYHEPRTPSPIELQLIESASQIAVLAIERHLKAEELQRSEARNAAILNSALDCIITIDQDGRITEFNPAAERTFGYRRSQVLGRHMADIIIPPSLQEPHRLGMARFLATGEARVLGRRLEMPARRADGSEFPAELAITRISVEGPPSFTGYLRDISERKQAEEELRRSAAYLVEAQELSLTGSFRWSVSADDHFWSAETFRIFEYDPSTRVTLQLVLDRAHPQDLPIMQQRLAEVADGKDFEYECRFIMPSGCVKHLHVVAHATRDGQGQLEYIGAVQDITERRLAEEALNKARSELAHVARVTTLGALTASIAHEVNQPLAGIINNANTCLRMLSSDPPNIDGALETARRTIRDGNRASDVIQRLRALFSKTDMATEGLDLNEISREVIALSFGELQRSGVILRQEFAENLPLVAGDRVQLQQVVLNLLMNAVEAMSGVNDRPKLLTIKTELEEGEQVRLTVQDAGEGFGSLGADKVFEAFYTTKSSGMGIGLSVSKSIIESHRGRLWAASNEGPGVSFSFSIPRVPEDTAGNHPLGSELTASLTKPQQVMGNS